MRKYKVGLVGCGHISVAHLKAWRKTEACYVEGVFDVNRDLAAKRAKDFQIKKIYDDLDAVIAECDVVDVCTPPQTHSEIALKVIRAGKHLVIEKPLVTDVADWDRMREVLDDSPSSITIIHNLKYMHSVQQAKAWVDEGRIGDILAINRQFLTSPDTDRMLVGNTHWSHRLPGGRWFETMPHELYLFHYFAGALNLDHVLALHTSNAPPGAPADEVMITLKGERCIATMQYSANCEMNKRMLMIYGTNGTITIDILSDYVFLTTKGDSRWKRTMGLVSFEAGKALARTLPDRAGYLLRRIKDETPHARIIHAFDQFVQGKSSAPTPVDEIDYVVRNCDRIGREIDKQLAKAAIV